MNQRAFLAVVLSATIAGFGGIFIKHFTMPATSIAWMRTGLATAFAAVLIVQQGRGFFKFSPRKMLGVSLFNSLRMWLFLIAFIYTSIGNAIILFYSWPIFVAVFGGLILKERFSRRETALLLLAFVGLVVAYSGKTFSFEDRDFVGMLAAIGSSLIYAFVVIAFKSEAKNYGSYEMVFYQNFTGSLIFLPFFVRDLGETPASDLWLGLAYATSIGVIGYMLFFYGLRKLKAATASALMYIEVVSAILLSYLWMSDELSTTMIIGGVMIIGSSFLLNQNKG